MKEILFFNIFPESLNKIHSHAVYSQPKSRRSFEKIDPTIVEGLRVLLAIHCRHADPLLFALLPFLFDTRIRRAQSRLFFPTSSPDENSCPHNPDHAAIFVEKALLLHHPVRSSCFPAPGHVAKNYQWDEIPTST